MIRSFSYGIKVGLGVGVDVGIVEAREDDEGEDDMLAILFLGDS